MPIFAPVIPLVPDDISGYQMYDNLKSLVVFHMKNLLLTSPGERIHDPNYGAGVKRFLFEQITRATFSRMEDEISSKIEIYMPYVNLEDVRITSKPDSNKINIKIQYNIPATKESDEVTLELIPNSVSVETNTSWTEKIF